jgi:hypothetical protein
LLDMSVGKRNSTKSFVPVSKQFAAATDIDLLAASPDRATAAHTVVPIAGGTFTKLVDSRGNDNPISVALPAGYKHTGDFVTANCSVPFIAYW